MNLGTIDIINLVLNRLALGFMAVGFISHYIGIFKKEDRYYRLAGPLILLSLIIGTIQTSLYFYFVSLLKNGIPNFWILINHLQPGIITMGLDSMLMFLVLGGIYYMGFKGEPSAGRQGWNIFFGVMAFLFGFLSDIFYSITESYTIGPAPETAIRTPMVLMLIIEKNVEIIALAGAVIAIWAGIRYIFSSKPESKTFFDWMGSFGAIVTMTFLAMYPVIYFGWLKHFRATSSIGFNAIMLGKYQWIMFWFMGTVGGSLIFFFIYMLWKLINGRDRTRPSVSVGLIIFFIIVAAVSLVFGMLPATAGILGNMQPVKYLALSGLFLTGFLVLGYYLKDLTPNFKFGTISKLPQIFLILAGLGIVINVPLMGYMKNAARGTDMIIYQTMKLDGSKYVPPVVFPWPVTKGYSQLSDKCVICHTLNRVERYGYTGLTSGDWEKVVNLMKVTNGCPITAADAEIIVDYLNRTNIIAYNENLEKQKKAWTPPASLPYGASSSASGTSTAANTGGGATLKK